MNKPWFDVDKQGLAKILARKGKEFAIFELLQNAWDEDGTTTVDVTLLPVKDHPRQAFLRIADNAPNGFSDITHAYTLFASSKKASNPIKRGRFNLGEKLVLAMAREATITTTTGRVRFDDEGRYRSGVKTAVGSEIEIYLNMTKDEIDTAIAGCAKLIAPKQVESTFVNQVRLSSPTPWKTFEASLLTEIADDEGVFKNATRKTVVEVYQATAERPAAIYEMGIPVCEVDGRFSFNVMQKIPLTLDRENVLVAFRRQLAVAAMDALHDNLDKEDVNSAWVTEALPNATHEAVESYMDARFGEKRVAYDPSDREANMRATAQGYTVVHGSMLSGPAWDNVKSAGAIMPAGQVTPSPKPFHPDGTPLKIIEPTEQMKPVVDYAKRFAWQVLSRRIQVKVTPDKDWPFAAAYGPKGVLYLNAGQLGDTWFDLAHNQVRIDDLLIHEFGHEYCSNHLSPAYHDALTLIGAQLANEIRKGRL